MSPRTRGAVAETAVTAVTADAADAAARLASRSWGCYHVSLCNDFDPSRRQGG